MAQQKALILYDNRLDDGTPTATSTATDYDVLNLKDLRPYTWWMATGTPDQYLTVDCGSAKTADALGIMGHNLATVGATISVECSSDNFAADTTIALAGFTVSSDKAFLKLFTSVSKRYWRLKLTGMSAAPKLAVLTIGDRFQFERFINGNFDPASEKLRATSKRGKTGHRLGVALDFIEIDIDARWRRLTPSWVKNTFMPAWDNHLSQVKPFFWSWEPGDHSDEVYFVQVPEDFALKGPYDPVRRSLSLTMEGTKEAV